MNAAARLITSAIHRYAPSPGHPLFTKLLGHALGGDAEGAIMVTRHADVREVLSREQDFSVRIYAEKMRETTGDFFLGTTDDARYRAEAGIARRALHREDLERVRQLARNRAHEALAPLRRVGRIDLVKDLAEPVVMEVVTRYLGVPGDAIEALRLLQTTSRYVFSFWRDPVTREQARVAGAELRRRLDASVAARRAAAPDGSDVLGRLLAMPDGFDDDGVARTVAGLASGATNAPLGILVYSAEKLLDLAPEDLAPLRRAALDSIAGDESADLRIRSYLEEAERFVIYPPFVYRFAERHTVIAAGTPRETYVPKGATVVTWQSLAAFDSDVVDDPWAFRPGRPKEQFLGMGHGRHYCVGDEVGQVMIAEAIRALFSLPGVRRAPGARGKIVNLPVEEGRYPVRFELEFEPHV